MDMGGVTRSLPPGEAAVRAVEAGADVLLMPPVPDAAMAGLEDAVRSGRIPESASTNPCGEFWRPKRACGLNKNRFVDVAQLNENFARPNTQAAAQEIADRGVTLLRDTRTTSAA